MWNTFLFSLNLSLVTKFCKIGYNIKFPILKNNLQYLFLLKSMQNITKYLDRLIFTGNL